MHVTPATLLAAQLRLLDAQLPGIRDGDVDAIHDGRVATRRIRELLPLCEHRRDAADDLPRTIRRLGRRLGRIRELDVEIALLNQVERRVPRAGTVLALQRHQAEDRKQRRLRKLLKHLPDHFVSRAQQPHVCWSPRHALDRIHPAAWRRTLRQRLSDRHDAAVGALASAGGVFFPNRLHEARIAIKKLRYAAELATATRLVVIPAPVIRRLRKAQDTLGDIHDWQLLLSALEAEPTRDDEGLTTAIMLLRSDIHARHQRFLERRSDLLRACDEITPHTPAITAGRAIPAATALALTAIWTMARARR